MSNQTIKRAKATENEAIASSLMYDSQKRKKYFYKQSESLKSTKNFTGNESIDDPIFTGFTLYIDYEHSPLFCSGKSQNGSTTNPSNWNMQSLLSNVEGYDVGIEKAQNSAGFGLNYSVFYDNAGYSAADYLAMVDNSTSSTTDRSATLSTTISNGSETRDGNTMKVDPMNFIQMTKDNDGNIQYTTSFKIVKDDKGNPTNIEINTDDPKYKIAKQQLEQDKQKLFGGPNGDAITYNKNDYDVKLNHNGDYILYKNNQPYNPQTSSVMENIFVYEYGLEKIGDVKSRVIQKAESDYKNNEEEFIKNNIKTGSLYTRLSNIYDTINSTNTTEDLNKNKNDFINLLNDISRIIGVSANTNEVVNSEVSISGIDKEKDTFLKQYGNNSYNPTKLKPFDELFPLQTTEDQTNNSDTQNTENNNTNQQSQQNNRPTSYSFNAQAYGNAICYKENETYNDWNKKLEDVNEEKATYEDKIYYNQYSQAQNMNQQLQKLKDTDDKYLQQLAKSVNMDKIQNEINRLNDEEGLKDVNGQKYQAAKASIESGYTTENFSDRTVSYTAPKTFVELNEFKAEMKKIIQECPYILQEIEGLDTAYNKYFKIKDPYLGSGEDYITIKCFEALDLKVSSMFNKYFNAAYDRAYRRERLPVNLRRFNCSVFVHDIRNFKNSLSINSSIYKGNYSTGNLILELAQNYVSVVEFKFYDCEFIPEETGNIFETISNAELGEQKMTQFTFSYGNCVVNFLPFHEFFKKNILSSGEETVKIINKLDNINDDDYKEKTNLNTFEISVNGKRLTLNELSNKDKAHISKYVNNSNNIKDYVKDKFEENKTRHSHIKNARGEVDTDAESKRFNRNNIQTLLQNRENIYGNIDTNDVDEQTYRDGVYEKNFNEYKKNQKNKNFENVRLSHDTNIYDNSNGGIGNIHNNDIIEYEQQNSVLNKNFNPNNPNIEDYRLMGDTNLYFNNPTGYGQIGNVEFNDNLEYFNREYQLNLNYDPTNRNDEFTRLYYYTGDLYNYGVNEKGEYSYIGNARDGEDIESVIKYNLLLQNQYLTNPNLEYRRKMDDTNVYSKGDNEKNLGNVNFNDIREKITREHYFKTNKIDVNHQNNSYVENGTTKDLGTVDTYIQQFTSLIASSIAASSGFHTSEIKDYFNLDEFGFQQKKKTETVSSETTTEDTSIRNSGTTENNTIIKNLNNINSDIVSDVYSSNSQQNLHTNMSVNPDLQLNTIENHVPSIEIPKENIQFIDKSDDPEFLIQNTQKTQNLGNINTTYITNNGGTINTLNKLNNNEESNVHTIVKSLDYPNSTYHTEILKDTPTTDVVRTIEKPEKDDVYHKNK